MGYETDRAWSDQFIPAIKTIMGPYLLLIAPPEIDMTEATDLLVFIARDVRIAARVRSRRYFANYSHDFTIRGRRDSGAKSEMSKIVDGWGDWMFYGFGEDGEIDAWRILSLRVFRRELCRAAWRDGKRLRCVDKNNGDGTRFLAFDVRDFPDDLTVASGGQ